jgi:hypothetical protein
MNDLDVYMRAAKRATLLGTPFESLADWAARTIAAEAAAKVINLADWRETSNLGKTPKIIRQSAERRDMEQNVPDNGNKIATKPSAALNAKLS